MKPLLALHDRLADGLTQAAPGLLPLAARLVFAGVLLGYFWASAVTKLGPGLTGIFVPSTGAYAQIFPRLFEAVGYDASKLGLWHSLVVLAGTWAEIVLPALLVAGLATRLAAFGMIGFVVVQSLTDILGHNADAATLGAWFDRTSDALILDQRGLWMLLLLVPVMLGGGWLSLDSALRRRQVDRPPAAS
ncbi:MAG: DoxX family membrane protein [Gemmobacter sp.]